MGRSGSGRRAEQRRRVKNRAKRLARLAAASLMLCRAASSYCKKETASSHTTWRARQEPQGTIEMRPHLARVLLPEGSPWSPRRARTLSYRPDSLALATELKHCEALGSGGDALGRLDALLGKNMPTKLPRAPALFSDAAMEKTNRLAPPSEPANQRLSARRHRARAGAQMKEGTQPNKMKRAKLLEKKARAVQLAIPQQRGFLSPKSWSSSTRASTFGSI